MINEETLNVSEMYYHKHSHGQVLYSSEAAGPYEMVLIGVVLSGGRPGNYNALFELQW